MKMEVDDPRLTAYALGELDGDEQREVEALVASSAEARAAVEAVRETAALLEGELAKEPAATLGDAARQQIEARVLAGRIRRWAGYAAAACLVLVVGGFAATALNSGLSSSRDLKRTDIQLALGPDAVKENADVNKTDVSEFRGRQINLGSIGQKKDEKGEPGEVRSGSDASQSSDELWAQIQAKNTTPKQFHAAATEEMRKLHALGYGSSVDAESPSQWPVIGAKREGVETVRKGDVWLYMDVHKDVDVGDGRYLDLDKIREYRGRSPVYPENGGESYDGVVDNPFLAVLQSPLSTFSIDVDTASYANIRRMLNGNQLPPASAVRIEEMVNYFSYDYPQPESDQPFSVNIETASCPWKSEHRLVRVGLKGREIPQEKRLPCNLVFLIDVSGSMQDANKLPLVKQGLAMLVQQLSPEDRVAMAVYAGASGLALPSSPVSQKDAILSTIDHLEAGGSTNGGEGIQLAYKIAGENFDKEGVNRVILATDGDFNVGVTNQDDLVKLVEEKAKGGVFLSVLGFGMGNLKDSTLEKLADKGNGNYAYIDTFAEAKKVLVDQLAGTLVTIAKDVKIQIEFNPGQVAAYRLIGYENRILAARDFNDDKKDAGEIGAGHTVTALYEIVPTSASTVGVDPLKYQPVVEGAKESRPNSDEMLTLKLRYKQPDGQTSKLIETPVKDSQQSFDSASDDLRFAASVAGFGMLLRNSPHKGDLTYDTVLNTATRSMGKDANGYRAEFVDLVRKAKSLSGN